MTSEPGPGVAVVSLHVALDSTADALAGPRLDALLASEAGLAAALEGLPPVENVKSLTADDRAQLRAQLEGALLSLRRCERLGASLTDFVRASLLAQGRTGSYGRSGVESEPVARSASLNTRG